MTDTIGEGKIELDSALAKKVGFTSDKFDSDSYLWHVGDEIWISFIESRVRRKGHFRALIDKIKAAGYTPCVPTPLGEMQRILMRWCWRWTTDKKTGAEIWRP